MARRASGSKAWTRMVQQQTRWVLRQAVSEGKKALKRAKLAPTTTAARKSPAAAAASTGGSWGLGLSTGPAGLRRYRLFKPTGLSKAKLCPLIVMLHGCGQSANDFAASTRMNRLAALYGFMVLYPEQDRLANAQACWNWFDTRNGRAKLEAASIVAALDHARILHPIDPTRVAIAGMSAGASMAALVGLHFPNRFAAVVMHSGVEPTSASSSATALSAMRGRYRLPLSPPGKVAEALPALLVIQGSADHVVLKANGMRAAQVWAARTHAEPKAARVVGRGKRYPFTTMDWFGPKRRLQVTLSEVNGLGHAWSGGAASQAYSDPKGPDASRMVWAFAQREFARLV
ncbi:PHB depolymerase family esterase [Rhodoferax sp. AJA081-3]|uniref:extracellular catalytic domain type 1 short-chain-length polyhydroxyalkanoate depolymerase n=1 Tax=Rhodoferax sp. AJA081-3 TaxID=2752316 RepID=UPI001ADF2992|nr:PHB depolymerase family esterase [Rhodoferax sp. AJA081-3]QTN28271.1 PHB depolymerase family esterase [Rhodoferax sp. AJA081-3]